MKQIANEKPVDAVSQRDLIGCDFIIDLQFFRAVTGGNVLSRRYSSALQVGILHF
jgi:hypothetical protein